MFQFNIRARGTHLLSLEYETLEKIGSYNKDKCLFLAVFTSLIELGVWSRYPLNISTWNTHDRSSSGETWRL